MSLENSMRENLQTCSTLHGDAFNSAIGRIHPSELAQVKQALKLPWLSMCLLLHCSFPYHFKEQQYSSEFLIPHHSSFFNIESCSGICIWSDDALPPFDLDSNDFIYLFRWVSFSSLYGFRWVCKVSSATLAVWGTLYIYVWWGVSLVSACDFLLYKDKRRESLETTYFYFPMFELKMSDHSFNTSFFFVSVFEKQTRWKIYRGLSWPKRSNNIYEEYRS